MVEDDEARVVRWRFEADGEGEGVGAGEGADSWEGETVFTVEEGGFAVERIDEFGVLNGFSGFRGVDFVFDFVVFDGVEREAGDFAFYFQVVGFGMEPVGEVRGVVGADR